MAGVAFACVPKHGGRCCIARNNQHFYTGINKLVHNAQGISTNLGNFERAVRSMSGVAYINNALMWQLIHNSARNGQTTHPGVKNSDGCA